MGLLVTGSFVANLGHILADLPDEVTGRVEVNQVYAHYQHEGVGFHHPDGGQALYLKEPLYVNADKYLQHVADEVIGSHGVNVRQPMIDNMEDLSMEVYNRAPWEFGDLRASGHPTVEEDGVVVYDRAPMCPRLSEEELKIKSHLRYLLDPNRYAYDRGSWS